VSNSVKAAIVLCFASLFWSGNFVIGRLASIESLVSPLSLGFYRWVIAFLILTPFCISKAIQDLPLLKKQPIMIFLIILTGPTLFNTLVYLGLTATTVINALLIISTTPMLIILFNRIIYKIDTNVYQMVGVAISLIGVSYVVARGNYQNIFQSDFYTGDLFLFYLRLPLGLYIQSF
jgi:drug/metabolite transporter (DMT)-like permease